MGEYKVNTRLRLVDSTWRIQGPENTMSAATQFKPNLEERMIEKEIEENGKISCISRKVPLPLIPVTPALKGPLALTLCKITNSIHKSIHMSKRPDCPSIPVFSIQKANNSCNFFEPNTRLIQKRYKTVVTPISGIMNYHFLYI